MTGGFDPARYTPAPLQTEGVIRFTSSPDAVFARITNHAAMTSWVPLLRASRGRGGLLGVGIFFTLSGYLITDPLQWLG